MSDRARRMVVGRWLAGAALITCVGCRSRQPPAALPEPEPVAPEPVFVETPEIPKPPPDCATRTPAGSPGLIPEGVQLIAHVSPRALLQSKLWSIYGPLIEPELGLTQMRAALSQCGSSLEAVDGALLGMTGDYDTQVVTILTGQGIGRVELIECVLRHQQSASESAPGLRVGSMAGFPEVPVLETDGKRVYLFHDDLAVLATDPLAVEVEARSRCAGVSAVDHDFAELLARTDTRAPLWLVSLPPRELAAQFESFVGSADSLLELSVGAYVDSGLALEVLLGMDSEPAAATSKTQLSLSIQSLSGLAPLELQRAIKTTQVEQHGRDVRISTQITAAELELLAP